MILEPSPHSPSRTRQGGVIKPWLSGGLIVALAGYVLLSAVLIIKLSGFEDTKRQAQENQAEVVKKRSELSSLKDEVDSLTKQKNAIAPAIVGWEKRLKEKADAEAALATLEGKQRQTESDISQAVKRLDEANRNVVSAEKLKTELSSEIEKLKAEFHSETKNNTDVKVLLRSAAEAERRFNDATNALVSVDARRRQLETDVSASQARFEQILKEADDLRQAREKSNTELASLRQKVQGQKDQVAMFDPKEAELKAIQANIQQEGQKLAKVQQQSATTEARATEMETRHRQAASEFAQLTNRLEQARKDGSDADARLDTAKAGLQKAAQDLAAAQKLLSETQASQDQRAREHATLVAQVATSKKDMELARKDAADAETRRDSAKAELQTADADLAAARTQTQMFSAKQGELTRETSRLETTVERLKKEKEALEKEIGHQEAQRQIIPPNGEK